MSDSQTIPDYVDAFLTGCETATHTLIEQANRLRDEAPPFGGDIWGHLARFKELERTISLLRRHADASLLDCLDARHAVFFAMLDIRDKVMDAFHAHMTGLRSDDSFNQDLHAWECRIWEHFPRCTREVEAWLRKGEKG